MYVLIYDTRTSEKFPPVMLLQPLYHYCAQWPLYLCLQWKEKQTDPYHLYLARIVLVISCLERHNLNSPSEFFSASEGKTPLNLLIAAATAAAAATATQSDVFPKALRCVLIALASALPFQRYC